jgi:hypothetical protein
MGIGNLLADGMVEAAEKIGRARTFPRSRQRPAFHRTFRFLGLGVATADRRDTRGDPGPPTWARGDDHDIVHYPNHKAVVAGQTKEWKTTRFATTWELVRAHFSRNYANWHGQVP